MSIAKGFDVARNWVLLIAGLWLGSVSYLTACTVFSDATLETVLAGRNWDMVDDGSLPVMWFVPASKGAYGRVCFGRHAGCEDGMNDRGLFLAVAATPPDGKFKSRQRPVQCPVALDQILAHCATVDEAIEWWQKQSNPAINSVISRTVFLGMKSAYRNSGVGGHILMADKRGDSVVCEWEKGKLKLIRKTGRYQLITNFLLSKPEDGGGCPRFSAATKILAEGGQPSVSTCTAALKATSRELTRYSVVYDLAHGDLQVYCRCQFGTPKMVNLFEELQKGEHEVNLYAWFGANAVKTPREGEVKAPVSIPEGDRK